MTATCAWLSSGWTPWPWLVSSALRQKMGKQLATRQDLWRPTAICGDLGGVMRVGLIRFQEARVLQQVLVTI